MSIGSEPDLRHRARLWAGFVCDDDEVSDEQGSHRKSATDATRI